MGRFIPVSGTNVTSMISWDTSTVDNYSKNHKTDAGGDFHDTEHKFDLARSAASIDYRQIVTDLSVAPDSKNLDDSKSKKQRDNPGAIINVLCT
jgi:hypothetical protein